MVQWVNDPAFVCGAAGSIPGPVQCVKDLALLHLWCRSQILLSLDPWLWNLPYAVGAAEKEKKKRKRNALLIKVILLCNQTWVFLPMHCKSNLLTPGCGEESFKLYSCT